MEERQKVKLRALPLENILARRQFPLRLHVPNGQLSWQRKQTMLVWKNQSSTTEAITQSLATTISERVRNKTKGPIIAECRKKVRQVNPYAPPPKTSYPPTDNNNPIALSENAILQKTAILKNDSIGFFIPYCPLQRSLQRL